MKALFDNACRVIMGGLFPLLGRIFWPSLEDTVTLFTWLAAAGIATGQTPEAKVSEVTGAVGLVLGMPPGESHPKIVAIVPTMPADKEKRWSQGDLILAVAPDGKEENFISTEGKTLQEVVALVRGPVGTGIALKVRSLARAEAAEREFVVRLTRVPLNIRRSGDAKTTTSGVPLRTARPLTVEEQEQAAQLFKGMFKAYPDRKGIVQPDCIAWRKVTLGMTKKQVEALLGKPREAQDIPGMSVEEFRKGVTDEVAASVSEPIPPQSIWYYGWLNFDSPSVAGGFLFRIFFSNDKVHLIEDPFGGRFSQDGTPTVPELTTPSMGQVFDHYPRFLDLRWNPSSGQYPIEYVIEVDTSIPGRWRTEESHSNIPYHYAVFSGANRGRWRVKAKNALGESAWSDYREFSFTK